MTLTLDGPADLVFPLFGPVRESEWDPGWRPEFVFPAGGGQSEEGAVFTVAHAGTGASTLWERAINHYLATGRPLAH